MRIAFKYGLLIAAGVIAWTVIAHLVVPNPASVVHQLGAAVFFNLLEIAGIALGIKEEQREESGVLSFKSGMKTGVAIAFVYGLAASLFFVLAVIFRPEWMSGREGAQNQPFITLVLGAFAGLFLGAIFLGFIYSTIISFIVIKRQAGRKYS